ncbi:MAG: hypothetical protein WCO92_00730 [Verrucomicrobiota bacterium]
MKTKINTHLLFAIICALLFSASSSFGLSLLPNGVTAMGWQTLDLQNKLPANTLAIAASTDPNSSDFVAVASDSNHAYNLYLLDHANLKLGWQKKYCFINTGATNLQYGLGHFVAMGTDRSSGAPVVATSADNGRTWSQSLVFAGKGHYDNAAFSDQMGIMTGKDGAIAISTDGVNWAETSPPTMMPRKIVYTNVAPAGATVDYQFQMCVVLPPEQGLDSSRLYGFLTFATMPVLGSLLSSDGKTWSYSIPYPIMRNQLLIYDNKTFLVNDSLSGVCYAYHDSIDLGEANFNGLAVTDPSLPLISVFQFASYQQNWVAVGYNLNTGAPLSLFSDSKILNYNIMFAADFFPQPVRIVAANQCGFVAVGDDGTSYYSTPGVPPATPSTN